MSATQYKASESSTQPNVEVVSLAAEGRLHSDPGSKVQAFIDLTLYFRPGGSLTVYGCTVLQENGKPPVVLLPGRKGDRRSFPTVAATGEIRRIIEQAVLKEFERLTGAAE